MLTKIAGKHHLNMGIIGWTCTMRQKSLSEHYLLNVDHILQNLNLSRLCTCKSMIFASHQKSWETMEDRWKTQKKKSKKLNQKVVANKNGGEKYTTHNTTWHICLQTTTVTMDGVFQTVRKVKALPPVRLLVWVESVQQFSWSSQLTSLAPPRVLRPLLRTRVIAACPHGYMQPKTLKFALSVQSSHWKKMWKDGGGKRVGSCGNRWEEVPKICQLFALVKSQTLSFRRSGAEQWQVTNTKVGCWSPNYKSNDWILR